MEMLSGKVGVVTGAASGIGRAICERFLAEGMRVVLADVEEARLQSTAQELGDRGDVLAVQTDVTDPASVDALAQATTAHFGACHVICNNAGVGGHLGLAWETPLVDWQWVMDVNVWGVINGIRSFVPILLAQGEGHVVNTSSQHGWSAEPVNAPYIGSKHAVLGISAALREDLRLVDAGIGVTVLCPGSTDTLLGTAQRNWPSALGDEPPLASDPHTMAILEQWSDTSGDNGMVAPHTAAEAVVRAIRHDRFVTSTHPHAIVECAQERLREAQEATL